MIRPFGSRGPAFPQGNIWLEQNGGRQNTCQGRPVAVMSSPKFSMAYYNTILFPAHVIVQESGVGAGGAGLSINYLGTQVPSILRL